MYKPSPSYQAMLDTLTGRSRAKFRTGGTYRDYVLRGDKYKDLTFEEWLQEDKPGYKPSEFGRTDNATGGRIGFYKGMSANRAPKKIKLKEPDTLTGFAGDRKLTAKQIDALDPNYLGDFQGGDLERAKKVYKSGTPGSVIDDAIEIRNIIVNNKGNIFGLEELGEKAQIYTSGTGSRQSGKGNRPDIRRVRAALEVAKDNFPEIANFKFVASTKDIKGRYKIDGSQRKQLNMVVDTIKNYQSSTGRDKLANFLPENMGMLYEKTIEKGPKKLPANPEKGLYIKMYNFGPEQIKYITDRITDETGKVFNSKDYKNLVADVKKYRATVGSDQAQLKRAAKINANIKKLYNDEVIQNLIRGDLNNKTKKQILNRAVQLIDDDVSVASKRLFMMAQSIAGTRPIEGINVDKNLGKKIIDTQRLVGKAGNGYAFSGLVYDHYGKVIDQALNSPKGKSFIGYYQQEIRKALDSGLVPDEIFSVTASARRGLEPYAIFTQALNADVNSRIKGANLDSLLSKTHRDLQNIFQGKTYNKLNTAEKKAVQDLVDTYENAKTDVLKNLKPSIRNTIQLPEFDLKNPPSKSIANYASYNKNLQNAFDRSYKNVGYGMKVTKDMKTQKELLDVLTKDTGSAGEKGFVSTDLLKDVVRGAGAVSKGVGKGIGTTLSTISSPVPAGILSLSEVLDYKKPSEDASVFNRLDPRNYEIQEDPDVTMAGVSLLLPELAKKAGIRSAILNPFNIGRAFTPVGLLTILGSEGYKIYKQFQELEKLKREDPEAYEAFRRTRVSDDLSTLDDFSEIEEIGMVGAANGGLITRQAFKDGFDPKKRNTMRILGGLASIPVLGKYIKILGPLAPKVVETVERGADAIPSFIYDLIAKIKADGPKFFTGNRADEFEYVYRKDGYEVREQGNKITVRKSDDPDNPYYKEMEMELELDPETGGVTYKEATARPDGDGKLKDIEESIEDVDLEEMKKYTYDE